MGMPGSSPNNNWRIVDMALLFVECPDGYSGCGGVGSSGSQLPLPVVLSLPSSAPLLIAGIGRQKL